MVKSTRLAPNCRRLHMPIVPAKLGSGALGHRRRCPDNAGSESSIRAMFESFGRPIPRQGRWCSTFATPSSPMVVDGRST